MRIWNGLVIVERLRAFVSELRTSTFPANVLSIFQTGTNEQNELCPGSLAEFLEDKKCFPYEEIPHFPVSTVKGHHGQMVFGYLKGVPVMCMQGRFHYYEGYPLWKVYLFASVTENSNRVESKTFFLIL